MGPGPNIYEVDLDGDTLLILRYPDSPFAVLGSAILWPNRLPNHLSGQMRSDELLLGGRERVLARSQIQENEEEIRIRLSSKHLTLASAYFEKMMANNWKETNPENGYTYVATAEEWDQKALLVLMNIIHGQTTKVPEQ